jgi:hypothetical protein
LASAIVLALVFVPQEKPTAISGNVVDAGTGIPLGKVVLPAELMDGGNAPASSTRTDLKGNFEMAGLQAGNYKGVRNGYLSTYYGARKSGVTPDDH